MGQKKAMAEIEAKYGGLEELVLHLLTEAPEVLGLDEESEPLGLPAKAERCELSIETTSFVLNRSPQFRALLRSDIVNQVFTLGAEKKHIEKVAKIAEGDARLVASPKGGTVAVDQIASDVIKAGEYLNKYRGSPLDENKGQVGLGIQINFVGREEVETIEVVQHDPGKPALENASYKSQSAGDLPPEAARRHYRKAEGGKSADFYGQAGGPLDFYSSEAAEKARDKEIAEKTARKEHPAEPSSRNGRVNGAKSAPMDR